jgi:hypothetical protein
MFTEESSQAIATAFEMASENQPTGEARIGELETDALSGIVEQMAGSDEEGEVIQYWVRRLDPGDSDHPTSTNFDVVVNGRSAKLQVFNDLRTEGVFCGSITLKLEGFGYYLVKRSDGCFFKDTDLQTVVKQMFNCLKEELTCPTCGRVKIDDGDVYCDVCKNHWNKNGCKVCGKRVGRLNDDGVHEPCAKKPRKE